MNKDRGTIKWNAMMLPEHVKLLREWAEEDRYSAKPELDEWAWQELSEQLRTAYECQVDIKIRMWSPTKKEVVVDRIVNIDEKKQRIYLQQGQVIAFASIYGAELQE